MGCQSLGEYGSRKCERKAPVAVFFGELPEYANGEAPLHLYFRN